MFKFDSQTAFLTYAQCNADAQALVDFFKSIGPIDWCRVALEHHEDGQAHRHCVIKFSKRLQSRNERLFDFEQYHPNIAKIKSIKASLIYCAKEEFIDFGPVPVHGRRDWSDIVSASTANDEMEWHRVVHEERISWGQATAMRARRPNSRNDLAEYDERPIEDIVEIIVPPVYKSLLVVGAPGIGKTGWAMKYAPRPCLLVKHMDALRRFIDGYHKSIVFDDMDFKHLPRATQMQLADYESQVQLHVRYGVADIPEHIPRLFLCNHNHEPFINDEAIQERRLQVLRI